MAKNTATQQPFEDDDELEFDVDDEASQSKSKRSLPPMRRRPPRVPTRYLRSLHSRKPPYSKPPEPKPELEEEEDDWQPQPQSKSSKPGKRQKTPKPQISEPPPAITSRQAGWRNANWPAWGHLIAAGIALTVWLGGTAVQVETSEAWFSSALGVKASDAMQPHFSVFNQIGMFWNGGLDHRLVAPYMFAWGTQAALVLFSIGVDLPAHTQGHKIRSQIFIWACVVLIAVNSLGDWFYAQDFGGWGQLGFVLALFVTTFCFGYVAIHQIHRAIRIFRGQS